MARLGVIKRDSDIENGSGSDSDFPEISDLVAKKARGGKSGAVAGKQKGSAMNVRSPVKKVRKELGKERGEERARVEEGKGKRRVQLGQVVDNPLLKPLSGGFPGDGKRRVKVSIFTEGEKGVGDRTEALASKSRGGVEEVDQRAKGKKGEGNPKTRVTNSVRCEGSDRSDLEASRTSKQKAIKETLVRKGVEKTRSTATPDFESGSQDLHANTESNEMDISKRKNVRKPFENVPSPNAAPRLASDDVGEDCGQVSKLKGQEASARGNPVRKAMDKTSSHMLSEPDEEDQDAIKVTTVKSKTLRTTLANGPSKPVPESESDEEGLDEGSRTATRNKPVRKAVGKILSNLVPEFGSDEEDTGLYSDGMSDFIVDDDDSAFLEEEDTLIEVPPPRSVRKLVRGRKPRIEDSDEEELDLPTEKMDLKTDPSLTLEMALKGLDLDDSDDDFPKARPKKNSKLVISKVHHDNESSRAVPPSSDAEDRFTLRYSPSMSKPRKISQETRFATPPASPELKPRGLVSPKKQRPKIPATPHRPSMDSFWEADVVNEWNDQYSPRKVIPPPQLKFVNGSFKPDNSLFGSPNKSPSKQDHTVQDRLVKVNKKIFSTNKHALAQSFLEELDQKVTNGMISRIAAETGGIKVRWSKKLNTTAGRAHWRKVRVDKNSPPTFLQYAEIELAEKILDDKHKLFNTIAHEFCHLANFMITKKKDNHHGKEFQAWGQKVMALFADRNIEVVSKHTYEIDYKFHWMCVNCGQLYKRHSRSIKPESQVCSVCQSNIVQVKGTLKAGKENGGKELGEYQLFVKENMKRVKQQNPNSPHKEMMGLVAKAYQEHKTWKLSQEAAQVKKPTIVSKIDSVEGVVKQEIFELANFSKQSETRTIKVEEYDDPFVSRKLSVIDLTQD